MGKKEREDGGNNDEDGDRIRPALVSAEMRTILLIERVSP
jgi:hypothetical protein